MKNRKMTLKIFTAVLLIAALLSTGIASAAEPTKSFDTMESRIEYLELMIKFIQSEYKYDVTEEELMEGAYGGLFDVLDEHSNYLEPENYEKFNEEVRREYEGIGVSITKRGENTVVVSPFVDTPAEKAGIESGDIIRYVDGVDISGYGLDKAAAAIRGETGTKVNIGIVRNGINEILYFDITRQSIVINEVEYKMLDDNIAYINIIRFGDETDLNLGKALDELTAQGMTGLVIDLRNNPGGLVSEGVKAADRFIEKGKPILYIDYKDKENRKSYFAETDALDIPLAVIINGGSASASEIFAGAIKDTGSGIVIGTQSFGKGTVQGVTSITNGGAIKLTIAEYLTGSEEPIDKVGIEPDFVVENLKVDDTEAVLDFVPMIEDDKPGLGDVGLNVYGAQQRLAFLGYDIEPTGKVDEATFEAVKSFQTSEKLYSYGVLDWTTKNLIEQRIFTVLRNGIEDLQLQTAIDKLK